MIAIIVLGSIIVLYINYAIANEFQIAAKDKGYPERKYFWYCFFFGIIGYLMVIALPDHSRIPTIRTASTSKHTPPSAAPASTPSATPSAASAKSNDEFWVCPACKTKNLNSRTTCWSCNTPKN